MLTRQFIAGTLCFIGSFGCPAAEPAAPSDFSAVQAIFEKHCLDCHATGDPEANLVLESFELLNKGGENGPVFVPGQSSRSLLIQMVEGNVKRDGKKIIMPPGKRKKLAADEIVILKGWIDSGAKPPKNAAPNKELAVPKIPPRVPPKLGITALAASPGSKLLAVGKYGGIELRSLESRAVLRKLTGHHGNVNGLVFTANGSKLFSASGENALFGEVKIWNTADGTLLRTIEGHKDTIYSLALSPDEKIIATGSYDQKIKLWDASSGRELKTLSGHNGAIFALAFRRDGKILASASGDRTIKLWDVASGERRDTLAQSLKELYSLAFSPDGRRLAAGGVDNRIRIWEVSESAAETTNPLLVSHFAHEGAILKVLYSPDGKLLLSAADDKTIRLWEVDAMKEKMAFEPQPDWAPALVFGGNNSIVAGRLDGTLGYYSAIDGKIIPPPKPEVARVEPRGIQRGVDAILKLSGSNLVGVTEIKFQNPKIQAVPISDGAAVPAGETWIRVSTPADLQRDTYEFSVSNGNGESSKVKLYIDDLPQRQEGKEKGAPIKVEMTPVSFWGTLEMPGDRDEIEFLARKGETMVFDLAAKSIGSKAAAVLTLMDSDGKIVASNSGFDGNNDPLLAHTFSADGWYRIRINDLMQAGSKDHFYRLSFGSFPFVTACFPLGARENSDVEVELIGYNLSPDAKVKIRTGPADGMKNPAETHLKPSGAGKKGTAMMTAKTDSGMIVPLDPEKWRFRKTFKILVGKLPETREIEPNDTPKEATVIPVPGVVEGRIGSRPGVSDVDYFRIHAAAGSRLLIETMGSGLGSPVDTKIEVCWADGRPVERLRLQAVRNSAINFRAIDSNGNGARLENWEEMELNEFLYLNGEVVRLFRMPQGPDSDMLFYSINGKRRTYFDTTATSHALDEPAYIVKPSPPGTTFTPNGLPVFPLYYVNDDDGERTAGPDSRVHFTAPKEGDYLVRVTDSRGVGGDRWAYRLIVREAKPDFEVTLKDFGSTINLGSGQGFTVNAGRIDGFDGEIRVDISGVPEGFIVSSPLIIEAGHLEARGTIFATTNIAGASSDVWTNVQVIAKAAVDGVVVEKSVGNFGKIKVGEAPKLWVQLDADGDAGATNGAGPIEISVAPGGTVPARLKIRRNGHEDLVTFTVENLPHGVIVDNIGLSGVLIPKGQDERRIFLKAAGWVAEQDRLCYAVENQAGKQTSLPIRLHVSKTPATQNARGPN